MEKRHNPKRAPARARGLARTGARRWLAAGRSAGCSGLPAFPSRSVATSRVVLHGAGLGLSPVKPWRRSTVTARPRAGTTAGRVTHVARLTSTGNAPPRARGHRRPPLLVRPLELHRDRVPGRRPGLPAEPLLHRVCAIARSSLRAHRAGRLRRSGLAAPRRAPSRDDVVFRGPKGRATVPSDRERDLVLVAFLGLARHLLRGRFERRIDVLWETASPRARVLARGSRSLGGRSKLRMQARPVAAAGRLDRARAAG